MMMMMMMMMMVMMVMMMESAINANPHQAIMVILLAKLERDLDTEPSISYRIVVALLSASSALLSASSALLSA